jgi:hypothetical protein
MSDDETDQEGFEVTGKCKACGTMLAAVSEDAWDRMMASHVIDKHADEAPEHILDEARERLEADA